MSKPGKVLKKYNDHENDIGEYVGGIKDGKRHGQGKMTYTNGEFEGQVYEGEWEDDKKNGFGILKWPEGHLYEGQWRNDKMNGKGTCRYADGSIYEGEWKNNSRYGNGKYTCEINGSVYKGDWKDDKMNGYGIIETKNYTYKGEWKDNDKHGWGEESYEKLEEYYNYEGEWEDGYKHGYGKYVDNEHTYEGQWDEDDCNGYGKVIIDGSIAIGKRSYGIELENGLIKSQDGNIHVIKTRTYNLFDLY